MAPRLSPFQMLGAGALVVALAVMHPEFLQDVYRLLEGGAGRTVSILLAVYCAFSIYKRVTSAQRRAKTAGTVGLRLSADEKIGWSTGMGWIVAEVVDGGAGQAAGIQEGDAVMAVDGEPVESLPGFSVIRGQVGSSVALTVERGRASAGEVVARVKRRDTGGREEDALPISVVADAVAETISIAIVRKLPPSAARQLPALPLPFPSSSKEE
jgi:membrane-associated protease RseP (regulator of RpoE activity)